MPRYDDDDRFYRRRPRDDDDEDDRPRSRRRTRRGYDDDDSEDRPRRKARRATQLNVAGLIGLIIAILAVFLSFNPCISQWYAIIPALVGMVVGLAGLWMSRQTDGRQGTGLPFTAMGVSALAIVIALTWLLLIKSADREMKKMAAGHRIELEATAREVQAETNPTRITAEALAAEYDRDPDRTDRRYTGKVLEVTGIVEEVDLEGLDHEYRVVLRTGTDETLDCDFIQGKAIRERLRQLKPGDRVTIRGKYVGVMILEGCILID